MDPAWIATANDHFRQATETLNRRSARTANLAAVCLVASALAWAAGAFLLTLNLVAAFPT